jgi:hypothetical protein
MLLSDVYSHPMRVIPGVIKIQCLTTKKHYRLTLFLCATCCNIIGFHVAVFMPRLAVFGGFGGQF